jgi:hypothetical protein
VVLPHDIELTSQYGEGVLRDILVLTGTASVIKEGNWSQRLYREFRPQAPETLAIRLIPYYAWDNRGLSEMTVWLPVK